MNTLFALLAKYETSTIALRDISQDFFGLTPRTAEQKAKACTLPVPTFKLRNSERAPTLIKIEDLADYIDLQYKSARLEWDAIQQVRR